MTTQFTYSIADDLHGVYNRGLLEQQIGLCTDISVPLDYIRLNAAETEITIVFTAALSAPEITALDTLVTTDFYDMGQGSYAVLMTDLSNERAVQIRAIGSGGGVYICASGTTVVEGGGQINMRPGTAGLWRRQRAEVDLSDADQTLTAASLPNAIYTITPSQARTLTLPTAAQMTNVTTYLMIDDAVDFTVINLSEIGSAIIAPGTGGSAVGNMDVMTETSGTFRVRLTNITEGTDAYKLYRIS